MASPQDIEKLKRNISETWEESFQGVKKNSDEFYKLVEEFTNFVGDWKEFSDVRRDRLAQYILDLDNVEDHWEDINDWVERNTDKLDSYVGSLSDIRSLFQSISSDLGGTRRQTADQLNIVRSLARLANESATAVQQEGGLTERTVGILQKKRVLITNNYEAQLKLMGVKDLSDEVGAKVAFDQEQQRISLIEKQINSLERVRQSGTRLTDTERERLRYLREQLTFHRSQQELVNKISRDAVKGLNDQIERQTELYRIQRAGGPAAGKNAIGANRVNVGVRLLRKIGLGEEARNLEREAGEFWTRRAVAIQNVENATEKRNLAKESLDSARIDRDKALQKAGSFARSSYVNLGRLHAQREPEQQHKEELDSRLKSLLQQRNSISDRAEQNTGEYRLKVSGQFIKKSTVEKLNEEIEKTAEALEKSKKALAGIDKDIAREKDLQKQYNQELSTQQKLLNSAQTAFDETEDSLTRAKKQYEDIFNTPFSSPIKDYLKTELPNLIAKLGVLLGALIYRQLLKFDEEAVKTKRVIGQWADASALANTKFVSGTEVLKTMRDLGEQFHINPVQVFSSQELGRIAEAQKLTEMSAQAAGNLGVQSKIIGKNTDSYRDSIAAGANQANKLNHSAVNLSAVQNDVLNTSRAITMSYGQNVEGLARAASTAASLGMNLQDVENISRNLINFQSSIESEMQAQLLTGQQLNLARARELALNNDLEGVAKEISSQGVDAAKFSHMNLIQQENMAKALGMSREQMSKMLIMQEINRGLTAQQVAAMTGMRKEDIEALSAQEKWQTMKQRFLETLVPLLEPVLQVVSDIFRLLTPIVGAISWILGKVSTLGPIIKEDHVYLRALVGTLAVGIPVALLKGINLVGVLGKAFKGLAKVSVSIGKSIAGWAPSLAAAGKNAQATGGILSRIIPQRDYQGRTARQRLRDIRKLEATKSVNPAGAAATSKASASMGSTISKIGRNIGKIALGAAAAVLIAGAVFILAKAAQEFMKVSWGAMAKAGVALLGFVATVAAVGAVMSSGAGTALILAGAAAMVIMAGAVALLGVALKQFEVIDWKSFDGIGAAMWKLASAGIAAMVAGPALMIGAIKLTPGAYALAQAFRILSTVGDVNTANILQTVKDLKSIEVPEVSKFLELQKIAQALVRASRILRRASFKPLENLSGLGTGLSSTANALVRVGEAIGLVATNLNRLDSEKLTSLRSRSFVGILARLQRRSERSVNLGEIAESPKETLTKANKELTIKKAEQVSTNQRISVEQKATDLRAIEQKIDKVVAAIGNSRPDWDWVKFEQARGRNLSWISG